ncbi:hypothetical protein Sango_2891300 [Sesamum angolense]|uniref:DUF4283 domain-containing protein n=1 Tax=Sesamum angolense TaxID=2727404 RepID=A0AAE1T627_9LAMI|nr:hypothetical protein Sango_2891300 [Sesamum angolense]
MATTTGGSSPPLRSYRDAVAAIPVHIGWEVFAWISVHAAPSALDARPRFSRGFLRRAINARHVFIKFALEENYTKLWIKSVWFVNGFPMRVFKWTPTFNPPEESPIVPVWVRLPKLPIQFFDREPLFSIARLLGTPLRMDVSTASLVCPSVARPVVYERLPKYYATCKHSGHDDHECYKKIKNRGPVRPIEGEDQRASDHVGLREKLDAQRAQRELHTRRKGKRVVFENVDRRPEASSSGAKGAEDGSVAMKLQDTVHEPEPEPAPVPEPQTEPEPLFHEEAVDGGMERDMPILRSPPEIFQGIADVATCPLEPAVPEELLP